MKTLSFRDGDYVRVQDLLDHMELVVRRIEDNDEVARSGDVLDNLAVDASAASLRFYARLLKNRVPVSDGMEVA